jgi:glycosyltransferase involved in cell wall biosynthesis
MSISAQHQASQAAMPGPHLPTRPWPSAGEPPGTAVRNGNGNGHPVLGSSAQPRYRPVSAGLAIAPTVTVVIPAMNEAANLPSVFATLPEWIDQVVLVDGRSTDDTIAVARGLRPDVTVIRQGGVGKGDALLAGFAAATSDIIVTMDADGSTDGREIIRFVSALVAGADFAKGSRFSSAGRSDDITAIRRYGNRGLNLLVNSMFGTQYSDLCYGYNAFWARHLGKLALDCPGFEVEALMGIRAAKARLRIHEVPSHERPREHGASNLHAIKDGCRILKLISAERFGGSRSRGPKPFLAAALSTVQEGARP